MTHLTMYDRAVALVQAEETHWATLGQQVAKHSPTGQRLAAFFRDAWNPWYTRVLAIMARELDDVQQAQFAGNVAKQLAALRDIAGYEYHLSTTYAGDPDAQLAEIGDAAAFVLRGLVPDDAPAPMLARRSPIATRHR